jgi:FKBP-type peptidyl-prolyl cis-trans isomerase FkpA
MWMFRRVLPVFLLVLAAACGGSSSNPNNPTPLPTAPYSQTDLVIGTGAEAVSGKTVTIHYSLWIYSDTAVENKGTFIQSSTGGQPFSFVLGGTGVIQGMNQGVTGMKVGGKRRLVIPPDLAYGSSGNGPIPPNATLVFEVDLVSVQ